MILLLTPFRYEFGPVYMAYHSTDGSASEWPLIISLTAVEWLATQPWHVSIVEENSSLRIFSSKYINTIMK